MQYRAIEPGIEVNGQAVWTIVDGFGAFTVMGSNYLLAEGIGVADSTGVVRLDHQRWYSQEALLRAYERIGKEMGDSALHLIGLKIPANAIFPPSVVDLDSAVRSIDVAYHLNHRRHGEVMVDLESGTMLEGIGHYGYRRDDPQEHRIVSVCNGPYPCSFDTGILTTMTRKFSRHSRVEHDPEAPCRKSGAEACTYVITW